MVDKAQPNVGKLQAMLAAMERKLKEATLKWRRMEHENRALQIECRRLQYELESLKRRQNHG